MLLIMRTGATKQSRVRQATLTIVALFAVLGGGAVAKEAAVQTDRDATARAFMPIYGETLPPIGYVQFCRARPDECSAGSGRITGERLSKARWDELVKVNDYVNGNVTPVTDLELYQTMELWTYPDGKGDCEDYVLLKRRYLINLGWSPESLLITVVRDRNGDGHAVLTVVTNTGDFVLDNQSPDILPWQSTGYEYQKRQSQVHPSLWVSLRPDKPRTRKGTLTSVLEVQK